MSDVPVPLVSFFLFHRSMRVEAADLVRVLSAGVTDDELDAVARWFDHYRQACLVHAAGEDKVLWPALLEARPDLAPAVAEMDEEHAMLAAVLDELDAALRRRDRATASELSTRLVEVLRRHLDAEEHGPLPALVDAHGDGLVTLIREVQQSPGPEGASIALPFLLAHATDDERVLVLGTLPEPLRHAYDDAWRAAYDALRGGLPH